jgi:diguanylate cyclase (GGDEF)-like protein/PAS domain S-box-containing protein
MLTVVPIAKEHIFESMREGVIVLDAAGRLIDYNRAVSRMLPGLNAGMVGDKLDESWDRLSGTAYPLKRRMEEGREELEWQSEDKVCWYQLRSSPVKGRTGEPVGSLLMLIDITEQRRLQDQLRQLAYYDGMTKLMNRTRFIQRGKELLEAAKQGGEPVSFILFDIDHFKRINDSFGHETGDLAILHVIHIAKRELPEETVFARYGGEEFVLAMPSCPLSIAAALADRIRRRLKEEPLVSGNGLIFITSSFGVAQSDAAGSTLESILRDADEALYRAKREGRNRVRIHSLEEEIGVTKGPRHKPAP